MKWKKGLAALLALATLGSLAACSGTGDTGSKDGPSSSSDGTGLVTMVCGCRTDPGNYGPY